MELILLGGVIAVLTVLGLWWYFDRTAGTSAKR